MRRRELLASAGVAASAGCFGQLVGEKWSGEHVQNVTFSARDATGKMDIDGSPTVEFRPEPKQVVVTGALWVGSSQCNEANVDSLSYDSTRDVFDVLVVDGKSEAHPDNQLFGSGSCTGDMSADAYELVATFRDFVPNTVVATEVGTYGKPRTTTTASR